MAKGGEQVEKRDERERKDDENSEYFKNPIFAEKRIILWSFSL